MSVKMTKGVGDQIKLMEIHERVRKTSQSSYMLLTLRNRVINLKEYCYVKYLH